MPDKPIILTGFMGSGKSSVGRELACRLGWRFVDLDAVIEADAGMSITEIFALEGESGFRLRESCALEQAINAGQVVISGGGGLVISAGNRQLMRSRGVVVNLSAAPDVIMNRLAGCSNRPLLSGDSAAERINRLMAEREHFYRDADIRIDTDNKSVEDVALEIVKVLKGLPSFGAFCEGAG